MSFVIQGLSIAALMLHKAAADHAHALQDAKSGSVPVNLTGYFNNQGFGTYAGEASFDVLNQSYPGSLNAAAPLYTSKTGIVYHNPRYLGPSVPDNIICSGQKIAIDPASYFAVSVLHSSDVRKKTVLGNLTFHYADNTTSNAEIRSEPWWAFLTINRGEITYDRFLQKNRTDYNSSHIFEFEAGLVPGKTLEAITLPNTRNETTGRIHIFALSLWGSSGVGVQNVKPTQRVGEKGSQIVEVVVNNSGEKCISGRGLNVLIEGENVTTIAPGHIKRLCPGDQKPLEVSVSGSGSQNVTVHIKDLEKNTTFAHGLTATEPFGLTDWTASSSSLARHSSPPWFSDAKYGIFIHWGPYSVPAWGNSTPYESYAEWFWWYTTHRAADKSGFYDYRLRTYGPNLFYDDFFPNFTATSYSPKEWVDLIADAGAKYFVLTTKHHDGFALFDAGNTTQRTSLNYGPRRDLLKELFDAAKEHHPELKRGTYFSLPEWFNPSWGKYGFSQYDRPDSTSHPGIIARNPYTNATEPYTGWVNVTDFLQDVMVPQMDILAYEYESDIMWCDAGASNGTADFASRWWNWARENGREVTINSRCGTWEANDFDTPEYETFSTAQRWKWESNRGMDPYSYGFNRATKDSEYMNATTIIKTLVDMVSKNGNLLLNVGPRADGTIPDIEMENLREAGKWIKYHGEAIFNTTYWFRRAELKDDGMDIRFTQTDDAFYILSLTKPTGSVLRIEADIPVLDGDRISLLGFGDDGMDLAWSFDDGALSIEFDQDRLDEAEYCWVFKIEYVA
ncbi:glycoside hydrolase family 29 protein [Periconia macrospinosa]|uniref:alpha-L-fucosidase n=1 Tax=Periconia macrospinosa TaxID=97972 RepID=A0A2V1DN27_9PLEO|nr:glycoside hydrolase family 29 protein [Periconia macrospinosa]